MPQNQPSEILTATAPIVKIGDSLASLEINSKVWADFLSLKTAPHFSNLRLSHKYGLMSFNGENRFLNEATLNLAGKYVSVSLGETLLFTGIVKSQGDAPQGTRSNIPSGENVYEAVGLDYLLDRVYVNSSVTKEYTTLKRIYSFNGDGYSLEKNRSASKVSGSYVFDWSSNATYWTARDIIEYLIVNFSSVSGISWSMSGVWEYLNNMTLQLNPMGKTVRQCMTELIRPEFGFSFKTDASGAAGIIEVFTITDTSISLDETTILPANTNTVSINDNVEFSRAVPDVKIQQAEQSAYSSIRVYSEPIRINATFKLGTDDGGLNQDWEGSDETEYVELDDDFSRHKEKYEAIYSRFKVSTGWDFCNHTGKPLIPYMNEDIDSLEVTFREFNNFAIENHVFERSFPVNFEQDLAKKKRKKPFVLLNKGTEESPEYILSEKTAYSGQDEERPSIGFDLLDYALGIQLRPPFNHITAKDFFIGNSDYDPIYKYTECLFSGSFYTDTVLACTVSGASLSGDQSRTKDIYIPKLHLWFTAPDTYYDADDKTGSTWTTERDDRDLLKQYASIAKAWYGRIRNLLSATVRNSAAFPYLGYIVNSVYSGGSFSPIGTVITSIDYDFYNQSMTLNTDFSDFDFSRLSRRSTLTTEKDLQRRISRLEEAVQELPVRVGVGGGSGSAGYDGPFAVSDSSEGETLSVTIKAGIVKAGLSSISVSETEKTISASCTVFLKITCDSDYVAEIGTDSTLPAETSTEYYEELAQVEVEDSKIKAITQIWEGNIRVTGRLT